MRFLRILCACCAIFAFVIAAGDANTVVPQSFVPDSPSTDLQLPQAELAYSIVIENKIGGQIRAVEPPALFLLARPGIELGHVLRPATSVDRRGYHASSWGAPQTVVASAVNAVHIKVYDDLAAKRAAVITLLPKELLGRNLAGQTSSPANDAIYTDIEGGFGIFGGSHPVIVGNPVSVYRDMQHIYFDPANTALKDGDVLIIEVRVPAVWPNVLTIDNREGGAVTLTELDGSRIDCGSVIKPVTGSGRFAGGVFCDPSGIRATHTAVIDIDLSPTGETGGLQLIPEAHSASPELTYSQSSPPYGILRGPEGSDLRAVAPLFNGFLYPMSGCEWPVMLPRLRVQAQLGGNPEWVLLPTLSGRSDLTTLSALRIEWVPRDGAPAGKQTAQSQ